MFDVDIRYKNNCDIGSLPYKLIFWLSMLKAYWMAEDKHLRHSFLSEQCFLAEAEYSYFLSILGWKYSCEYS